MREGATSACVSLHDRPAVEALGARSTVFEHRAVVMVPGVPYLGVFRIESDLEVAGVLEVHTEQLLDHAEQRLLGDEVLLLARRMRSTFRAHDRLSRFGGEELF